MRVALVPRKIALAVPAETAKTTFAVFAEYVGPAAFVPHRSPVASASGFATRADKLVALEIPMSGGVPSGVSGIVVRARVFVCVDVPPRRCAAEVDLLGGQHKSVGVEELKFFGIEGVLFHVHDGGGDVLGKGLMEQG